jgi:hypothetical protein
MAGIVFPPKALQPVMLQRSGITICHYRHTELGIQKFPYLYQTRIIVLYCIFIMPVGLQEQQVFIIHYFSKIQ